MGYIPSMAHDGSGRRYRIDEVLGHGGFGVVYRAELTTGDGFTKRVALKMLTPEYAASHVHRTRLRDEAVLLGLLRHRALVSADGLCHLGGREAIVMEYIPGVSLDALCAQTGPFPASIALQIAEELAWGLSAVHTAKGLDEVNLAIVHRDIKPKNVRLTAYGEVKLLDFGVAQSVISNRHGQNDSLLLGTHNYIAPERLDGECSQSSDIYSLALTLVALLTASEPPTHTPDPERHAARIAEMFSVPALAAAPDEIRALLSDALAWDPAVRPDARSFARRCHGIRSHLPDRSLVDWADLIVESHATTHSGAVTGSARRDPLVGFVLWEVEPSSLSIPRASETPASVPRSSLPPASVPSANPSAASVPVANKPSKRRWVWLVAMGVALGLLLSAAAALSAAAGGTAVIGALVVAALSDSDSMCVSTIRSTRQDLASHNITDFRRLTPLFDRALRSCREGQLGFFGAAITMGTVRNVSADLLIDKSDIDEVEQLLDSMESL